MRRVYIGSGPTLTAINRRDGSTLWTHVTGGDVTADIAVVAERVIASSHDGYVYALGPSERNPSRHRPEVWIRERGVLLAAGR